MILRGFLAITVHFAAEDLNEKKLVLRTRLGAFRHILGSHTGKNMAAHFLRVLEELDILNWV